MERLFKTNGIQSHGVENKKVLHKKQILRIFFLRGSLANSELSSIMRLSTPKINNLLLELKEEGLVKELGRGYSSGGRRPVIYDLVDDGFYVVGITMNIKHTIVSVFNSNNREMAKPRFFPISIQRDFSIFSEVSKTLDQTLQSLNINKSKVLVVGIDMPGLINQRIGKNITYFPEIDNLSDAIGEIFGLPVFIAHDSKVRVLAEQQFGLAKDKKDVLLLHVDWGLGLGIIVGGKLYSGNSGYSGEFGHLPIVDNGILCQCGKQGCLETIVSATAIERIAREGIQGGKSSLMNEQVKGDPEKIDISVVINAANRGDQFAISIFSEVGFWLGKGIVYLIQIFNPELIIIGGRLAEAGQFLDAPVQQAINTYSKRDISNDTEIRFSALGQNAGPVGAAVYAIEKIASV